MPFGTVFGTLFTATTAYPLSKASIATIALLNALAYWNDWFQSLLYIRQNKVLQPLQALLMELQNNVEYLNRMIGQMGTAAIMVLCPALLWLAPGFSPVLYGVFLLMGVALGGVDLCVYTMILECCSSQSVGRYSGYYYTVSMAAQVATPILSGIVMDVAPSMLFAYITAMGMFMAASIAAAKHGDAILIDEVARREAAE